jgi:hypothetical protein
MPILNETETEIRENQRLADLEATVRQLTAERDREELARQSYMVPSSPGDSKTWVAEMGHRQFQAAADRQEQAKAEAAVRETREAPLRRQRDREVAKVRQHYEQMRTAAEVAQQVADTAFAELIRLQGAPL